MFQTTSDQHCSTNSHKNNEYQHVFENYMNRKRKYSTTALGNSSFFTMSCTNIYHSDYFY